MSIYAVAWLYMLGLAVAVAVIGALAAARRRPIIGGGEAVPQVKWRCPICAHVFIEFEVQQYVYCPRCDSLLDAAQDATEGGGAAGSA